ncbi:hypothetical protein LUZ60_008799 [Juncus effusus]|nr:hypothetical protein LUZ60_008799 [Juncus effusus]
MTLNTSPRNFPTSIIFTALLTLSLLTTHIPVSADDSSSFSCSNAVNALVPCGTFLLGAGQADQPDQRCCQSAQTLKSMAVTVDMRKSLCKCLEQSGPSFGVQPERAKTLPKLCKLDLNIPISPNYNCDLIS